MCQLPLLIRSRNRAFLGGDKGCQAALEWSKLMRFNLNDKEFLSAADTLIITYESKFLILQNVSIFIRAKLKPKWLIYGVKFNKL